MNRKLSLLLVSLLFVYGCHQDKAKEYPEHKISNVGIAFKNVNLVPMTADKIVKAQTVLVKDFSGRLPDDITKIVVTGPNGEVPIAKSDFKYIPQLRGFYIEIPGSPDIGTYTFTIYSKNKIGFATDTQSMNIIIPTPVIKTDAFNNGNVLQTTTPTLSWEAVKTQNPVYYRVDIFDQSRSRIHRTSSIKNMLSYTVPKGILNPGQTYFWKIRISGSDKWTQEQNRSSSRLWKFSTKI